MIAARWLSALVAGVLLAGCTVSSPPVPSPPVPSSVATSPGVPSPPAGDRTVFVAVVDGDTIRTEAGTVRIIGIDTPERGECGPREASAVIVSLLSPGDPVWLELPPGQNDRDRHGRLVRFVSTADGVDVGLAQLEAGNAVARYDSTDGYPQHPREAAYHAAEIATRDTDGRVVTTSCANRPTPPAGDHWWEQYQSCGQLKRNTVGHPTGPFNRDNPDEADIYDWFANRTGNNGDGDDDGLACE